MTLDHVIPGRQPVAEALRARRRLREVVVAGEHDDLGRIAAAAREAEVDVRRAARAELDALSGGVVHQGVVAFGAPPRVVPLPALAGGDLVVVLDGITDPQNLGAIVRSAEQAGAEGIVLPKRRSANVTPAVEKASAGALSWTRLAVVPNLVRALEELAGHGYWSVGLAGDAEATIWSSNLLEGKVAVVVGAEGSGLSRLTAERVDGRVRIPMAGHLDSLNASVAAGITLFEVARRRQLRGR